MLKRWIESVFIKRVALAGAAALVAVVAGHIVPELTHLAAWGVVITIQINQKELTDTLTIGLMALSQGLHEWVAVKYPTVGKYL